MKVTVVTFHRAQNHGAVLQCFALNKTLQKLGAECRTLDYYPLCFKEWYCCKKPFSFRHPPVKMWLANLRRFRILQERNKGFTNFVKEYIPLTTPTLYTPEMLERYQSDTDLYIAGSDMIWNNGVCKFDRAFFLDFPDAQGKKCVSYAASFGDTSIPNELKEEYRRRLSIFNRISVREENGKAIVYNLIHRSATVECDPTLLLTASEWIETFSLSHNDKKDILVYYVEKTQEMQKYASLIGGKVMSMSCNMNMDVLKGNNDKNLCDEFTSTASPLDFLQAFYNAEKIITNSFHGLVFALIFHKPFLVKLENGGHINLRAKSLMQKTGTEKREFLKCELSEPIDWNYVDKSLERIRKESLFYLEMLCK